MHKRFTAYVYIRELRRMYTYTRIEVNVYADRCKAVLVWFRDLMVEHFTLS